MLQVDNYNNVKTSKNVLHKWEAEFTVRLMQNIFSNGDMFICFFIPILYSNCKVI